MMNVIERARALRPIIENVYTPAEYPQGWEAVE